jgi:hypothetical protein
MSVLTTIQKQWYSLRDAIVEDDSAVATFDFASWPTATYIVPSICNGVVIAFWGKGSANDHANYKLYGRRKNNGPVMLIATGVLTLGAQAVTKNPITGAAVTAKWVDTITNTADWIKDVGLMDIGNDRIGFMGFDLFAIAALYLEIDLDSSATEISAIITGA